MNAPTPLAMSLEAELLAMGRDARTAADALRRSTPDQRTRALLAMAREIRAAREEVLSANAVDLSAARDLSLIHI